MRGRIRSGSRLAALLLAATLALTGCVSWFQLPQPRTTSTPHDEPVSAELAPYYQQVLRWSGCADGMQCATAIAPLDWDDPTGDRIELALIRQPAQGGTPIGSLLVNPGGPGGSGFDFVAESVDYATSDRLQQRYDVVGFDPRGVGRSSAVRCTDDPAQLDAYLFDIPPGEPGSDEWLASVGQSKTAFGAGCAQHTGALLGHVDTESAARDLDLLRAALGDATLHYLGFSYGTLLGATYAELFPERTGRLVLDGGLDPTSTDFEVTATQATGFESAFRAYLADCLESSGCPFRGSVDSAMSRTRQLLDRLDRSPLPADDGRELGSATMFVAIIYPLYSPTTWSYLDSLFEAVLRGDPTVAFQLADAYYERASDGSYGSNSTEAFIAVNCLDRVAESDPAVIARQDAELVEVAPVFGPQMTGGDLTCANWPVQGTPRVGPIAADGSADILVVGTTNDPATPYVWSQALAAQLANGHLVTYTGEGHTAYNKSNACVDDAVDDYLIDGTVPETDPQC